MSLSAIAGFRASSRHRLPLYSARAVDYAMVTSLGIDGDTSMAETPVAGSRLVTVFGGSGFVGRNVVRVLAKEGWRIRVAVRRPDLAFHLQPLGRVGQIHAVQANLRYPDSVAAALRGADAAINLVGILTPHGRQTFDAVQAFGARIVARSAAEAGLRHLVHVSAIGADVNGASAYARSKGLGEADVRESFPGAIILRPSVIFGPEDDFFNRFGALAGMLPVLPLIGGNTRLQPVFVGNVAEAVGRALAGGASAGEPYELGGPEVKTMREILQYVCKVTGRKRPMLPIPFAIARYVPALATEIANGISLGLFPKLLLTTRDQVELLKHDNTVSQEAMSSGRTLEGLGIAPTTIDSVVPEYLYRFRKTGQFDRQTA
jgi:NADH dehydrogenase